MCCTISRTSRAYRTATRTSSVEPRMPEKPRAVSRGLPAQPRMFSTATAQPWRARVTAMLRTLKSGTSSAVLYHSPFSRRPSSV